MMPFPLIMSRELSDEMGWFWKELPLYQAFRGLWAEDILKRWGNFDDLEKGKSLLSVDLSWLCVVEMGIVLSNAFVMFTITSSFIDSSISPICLLSSPCFPSMSCLVLFLPLASHLSFPTQTPFLYSSLSTHFPLPLLPFSKVAITFNISLNSAVLCALPQYLLK